MKSLYGLGLLLAYCGLSLGCGDAGQTNSSPVTANAGQHNDAGHDHGAEHDHPETLEAGLKELVALRDTVRDAFAKNDTETAHVPLHDVGHLLEDITGLVEKRGLSSDATASAKQQIETLFESFGAVDKTMHGQEGSTYSEVSAKIDAAIQSLQALTPADAAPADAAPADAAPADAAPADAAPADAAPAEAGATGSEPAADETAKPDAAPKTDAP